MPSGVSLAARERDAARPVLQPRCLDVKIDGTGQQPEILMGVGRTVPGGHR